MLVSCQIPAFRRVLFILSLAVCWGAFTRHADAQSSCANSGLGPSSTAAAANSDTLPCIVVIATRLPTPVDQVASSVTVITADEIDQKQERTLSDVLSAVPGLNIVQGGGPGAQADVFMRGANSNHTKIFIDGIDVSDPSSADGAFDFGHVLTSDIQRVEVLRGPQSGLYGSDAIGGVINIVTKSGGGPAQFSGSVEGGSFATFNQTAALSGTLSRFTYAFDVDHYRSGATPVTPLDLLPKGQARIDDYYDNATYSTKLGADVTDNFDLGLIARYVNTDLRFTGDDFSVPPFTGVPAAAQSDSQTRQFFTRGDAHWSLFDGVFRQTLAVDYTDYRRRDIEPDVPPNFNRGDRIKLNWQGDITIAPSQIVTVGAEHQRDEIRNSPISAETTNDAGFVQLQSSFFDRLFDTVSVRYDDSDRFGSRATYRIAPVFLLPETGTKFKGSVGTGFKGPSLEELFVSFPAFNFFANPNLKPEDSFGYDLGFEQNVLHKKVDFGATYFHNDIDNLIEINATNFAHEEDENIAKAVTYGAESYVAYRPFDVLKLRADYTYTMAEDAMLHQELLRRPKHKASASATWQVTEAANLSLSWLYVGPWIDGNRDFTIPRLKAGGYTLVNLAGSYDLTKNVTAFARIDNLLDRHYQEPVGFQRPGFGIFVGLRVSFDGAGDGA